MYINQRDAQILVNILYFFVKWLYMFRTIISPSSGAKFNKLYSATGTCRYVWLQHVQRHVPTGAFSRQHRPEDLESRNDLTGAPSCLRALRKIRSLRNQARHAEVSTQCSGFRQNPYTATWLRRLSLAANTRRNRG